MEKTETPPWHASDNENSTYVQNLCVSIEVWEDLNLFLDNVSLSS